MNDDTNETGATDTTVPPTGADQVTVRRDWDRSVGLCVAVVEAVAAATNRTPMELPPLQHSLDPDALEALLARDRGSQITVSFNYAGTVISILENDVIDVEAEERVER